MVVVCHIANGDVAPVSCVKREGEGVQVGGSSDCSPWLNLTVKTLRIRGEGRSWVGRAWSWTWLMEKFTSPKFSKFGHSTCHMINTHTCNNSSVKVLWCEPLLWCVLMHVAQFLWRSNYGGMMPCPSLQPHSTLWSQLATHLWFPWWETCPELTHTPKWFGNTILTVANMLNIGSTISKTSEILSQSQPSSI